MSLESSQSHAALEQPLHGSLSSAPLYSGPLLPVIAPTPRHPSSLRHTSAPIPTAAPLHSHPTFAVLIGSPPQKSPAFGNLSTRIKKRGRPFRNPQGTPPTQMPPKKVRRPFKTPGAVAAQAAATAAPAHTDQLPKKRRRPVKYPQEPDEIVAVVPPEPIFIPFICEWKGCPAELHNLDTLTAHLITVHLKKQKSSGSSLMCLWGNCSQEHKVVDIKTGASSIINKGVNFKTKEEWRNHMKVAHLDPVAWHQGDGPKATLRFGEKSESDALEPWLYNENGLQVTPSVVDQPREGGQAKENNAARFKKKREGLYIVFEPIDNL